MSVSVDDGLKVVHDLFLTLATCIANHSSQSHCPSLASCWLLLVDLAKTEVLIIFRLSCYLFGLSVITRMLGAIYLESRLLSGDVHLLVELVDKMLTLSD